MKCLTNFTISPEFWKILMIFLRLLADTAMSKSNYNKSKTNQNDVKFTKTMLRVHIRKYSDHLQLPICIMNYIRKW